MNPSRSLLPLLLGCVLAVIAGALFFAVHASTSLPDRPVEVVWNKAACEHCRMHLGEPGFAVQIVLRDGRVCLFDDPGCMFGYVAAAQPDVHATWFHELHGDGWLPPTQVAFVQVERSPMGFGIGAVPLGTPGSFDEATAQRRCAQAGHGDDR